MRLLLTGASGFLGRHVLGLLRQHGVAVWTLGRGCPPGQSAAMHIYCDLLAGGDLAAPLRQLAPSHLLHLAWVTDHNSYQTSARNADWARATEQLARAFCDAGGRHLVAAGSCAEYDWSSGWCDEDTTAIMPASAYGAAKEATRQSLQTLCTGRGVRLAWARVFFTFGAGQSALRLIPSLVAALRGTRRVFKIESLQRRDFLAAPDVAQAFETLLQAPAAGCYNISSAKPVALGDLVRTLARLLDADPRPLLALAATDPTPPALVAGDNRRLRALGWCGPSGLVDRLAQMIAQQDAAPMPANRAHAADGH